jgi:membrane protease subunit (stomatin/prohibitin family)
MNQGRVIGYFQAPGYLKVLKDMLNVFGHFVDSDDGFMPHTYYAYVGMHISQLIS